MPKFDQDDQVLTDDTELAGTPWKVIRPKLFNDEGNTIEDYADKRWFKNLKLGPVGKRLLDNLITC